MTKAIKTLKGKQLHINKPSKKVPAKFEFSRRVLVNNLQFIVDGIEEMDPEYMNPSEWGQFLIDTVQELKNLREDLLKKRSE